MEFLNDTYLIDPNMKNNFRILIIGNHVKQKNARYASKQAR